MASPLGKISMENGTCTACGLCAAECSTGALSISMDAEGHFELLFRHGACIACGACVDRCPEKCLRLERTMEPVGDSAEVLFAGDIALCPECGKPVGPKAMIESISKKLGGMEGIESQIGLCAECKSKSFLRAG